MKNQKSSFYLISLGCAKNLVDSTSMADLLKKQGYIQLNNPSLAEYLIVNTCGFIESARQESISVINELAKNKKNGQILIAAGCMTQRYQENLLEMVDGVNGMIGTRSWMDIMDLIRSIEIKPESRVHLHFPNVKTIGRDEKGVNRIAIQGNSSYLKIADGCRRHCAFCAIPMIKGPLVSRSIDNIVRDACYLESLGIKEINLIAQDVTDYGNDLGMKDGLVLLLHELLEKAPNIPWIRLLYTFPGYVSHDLITLMKDEPRLLPYLDMPLQHAEPEILKSMQRPSNMQWVRDTLKLMREKIPELVLRTTFIVGYPGETEEKFETLLNFVKEIEFDHIGVFTYSFEKGTSVEPLGDPIAPEIKTQRIERIMSIQSRISLKKNQALIGNKLDVLIEGKDKKQNILIGRSYRDAPEIDGLVIVQGKGELGEILQVKITAALEHDLIGKVI